MTNDEHNKKEEEKENNEFDLAALEAELKLCRQKAEEYLNGWKRAKADYSNLKKENQKEKEQFIRFANIALIFELLPVINNFKRAFEHEPKEISDENLKNYCHGFKHIYSQAQDLLKRLGIEEIKTVGQKFNPELHEAVDEEKEKDETKEQNTGGEQLVVKEISAGYALQGKVIMPAKVVVRSSEI